MRTYDLHPSVSSLFPGLSGGPLGASGTVFAPALPATFDLATDQAASSALLSATELSLDAFAASDSAKDLVAIIADLAASWGKSSRSHKMRERDDRKARTAVGAIVGGLLRCWAGSPPTVAFRPVGAHGFTGGPVGYSQLQTAADALVAAGLVGTAPATRYVDAIGGSEGAATRYWPSQALLDLAAQAGVSPATIRWDFPAQPPIAPPRVPDFPVEVLELNEPPRGGITRGGTNRSSAEGRQVPLTALGPYAPKVMGDVYEMNSVAGAQEVLGCAPPRWKVVYRACGLLGGRWCALGTGNQVYQRMTAEARRADITINGEGVVEVAVRASHLTIMHGLLGLPVPEDDLYDISGIPREVVKAWVLFTLDHGQPITAWPKRKLDGANPLETAHARAFPASAVGDAVCARYPFLRDPAASVAGPAGLDDLSSYGPPRALLTHRLQNIEARALSVAMIVLARTHDEEGGSVLALPLHDSLIVPASAAMRAVSSIKDGFSYFAQGKPRRAGWTIRTTVRAP